MGRHTKPKRVARVDTHKTPEARKTKIKIARHLGETARAARMQAKLTQADVAERVGIATEVYGRLERGAMLPSVPTLLKLCSALHADANALLGLKSGLPLVSLDVFETQEEPPRVRQVLRSLRRLTPTQLSAVGHVASTFAKSNGAPADTDDASPQGQNA
ncbi:helix-turn-helix transcriptional regulator [Archangium sp.]|uniref:helix-turn-helix transcriptional regulator n=1 Tax=Archangium sp. TaxID=1872627 RepID=UPI00389A0719